LTLLSNPNAASILCFNFPQLFVDLVHRLKIIGASSSTWFVWFCCWH
jgi:hypothetical protein